ncbi:hypothetical protein [Roseobacter litoralis]|uniref:Uncharacterized protein n=1 Tax=Roseobacter litoralis (strain ATCC 49566 / DSM 6996 / JCM 21268 / NBRC 15278 / OCh 149) TaxID=391595 RepID=F7ZBR5_ROSLO|nr:hypothetical protein [Roseobacter litoralis]AEI93107.1 hypothetical protein RLO149_c011000 [Roseobacter litoralis Och 149]
MSRFNRLTKTFLGSAKDEPEKKPEKKKRPAPISVRLNETELKALRQAAAGRSMNGYIRERLFGAAFSGLNEKTVPDDYAAMARILGALGQSDVYTSLAAISLAIENNRLPATRQTQATIDRACLQIEEMRSDLLIALGLRSV